MVNPTNPLVTDAMVEAAWQKFCEPTARSRDLVRAMLEAALPRGEEPQPWCDRERGCSCRFRNVVCSNFAKCPRCDGKGWEQHGDPEIGDAKTDCPQCGGFGGIATPPLAPSVVAGEATDRIRLCRYGTAPPDMQTQPCACAEGECCLGRTPPAAAGAAIGWQPIETAPKDGTAVFVYVKGDSLYPTAAQFKPRAYWEKEYGDPEYMAEGWYWSFGYPDDFHEEVIEPSHWMPLPTPPSGD